MRWIVSVAAQLGIAQVACSRAMAQERLDFDPKGSCNFYGDEFEVELYSFKSSAEAQEVVQKIADSVALPANFSIMVANVRNAAAVVKDGKRLILYSEAFIERLTADTGTDWSAWTVLAHEVGHHLSGHTLDDLGSRPERELEADRFAGFAAARMGATLEQCQSPFRRMSEAGSDTHPGRSARIEAVTVGWKKGRVKNNPDTDPDLEQQEPTQEASRGDDPAPQAVINPQSALETAIDQLRNGEIDESMYSPHMAGALYQQLPLMQPRLAMAGPIQSIRPLGSRPQLNGAIEYGFAVQFAYAPSQWRILLSPEGLIVGLWVQ